ncbi:hypothetical protein IAF52_09245 [Acinetobacter baumannii]|uniref:hypothetical protein n=1 Tax=Acinetobacter baumannii TaxID=470 RepID=UPI000E098EE6|nr:hypothetical protein [Acinetobacter baumannii]EKV0890254.1 hypothetical protein [Acinetobacter baumannii]MBD0193289.1 hypothetical protein [Acinetobacter baumannii]MBS0674873.1 hypothetical protein [Acinetobacter baumannii]MCD9083315.1 hypothetical protein [Acinetobacter baumannii]MCV7484217.1 hypothetical protein [Acinetobacter baumannii]
MTSKRLCIRIGATAIVFAVLMFQTLLVKLAFESNPESAKIVAVGFMAANISAICTWILFPES